LPSGLWRQGRTWLLQFVAQAGRRSGPERRWCCCRGTGRVEALLACACLAADLQHQCPGSRPPWRRPSASFTSRAAALQLQRALHRSAVRDTLETAGCRSFAIAIPLRLGAETRPAWASNGLVADDWLSERGVIAELPELGCLTFCLGAGATAAVESALAVQLSRLAACLGGGGRCPGFLRPPLAAGWPSGAAVGLAWRFCSEGRTPGPRVAGWRANKKPLCPYPPGISPAHPRRADRSGGAEWAQEQRRLWPGQIA